MHDKNQEDNRRYGVGRSPRGCADIYFRYIEKELKIPCEVS